ncbi:MAG: nitrite/sulfite reductase, partial [Symploca sp. SIO2B6]|nr:nitrite/sulfite reductase [Symploca sp. SIO2B6]
KIAFSGCKNHPCGLTSMHDLGLIAKKAVVDGEEKEGFEMYVGGGLGAVPFLAKLFDEFVLPEELLPLSQAIARVYARLGEKQNRNKARIKFLIQKLGIDEFRRLVKEERTTLENDPGWTEWLSNVESYEEKGRGPVTQSETVDLGDAIADFEQWKESNVYQQRQAGYVSVTLALPLGDLTGQQMRDLAAIVRTFTPDAARTTVEQNIMLRWIHEADLPALYLALKEIKLHEAGAQSIIDITACPGTDTCKLGISSSRGLAGELRQRLAEKEWQYDVSLRDIRIKASGCFNSCSQHTVAEIGFYGASRVVGQRRVPHFHLVLGGEWDNNAAQYGKGVGVIPSKRVPDVVEFLIDTYLKERQDGEKFPAFVNRVGRKDIRDRLKPFMDIPDYETNKEFYRDWADSREYSIGDIGIGECAGEVVTLTDFGVAKAESIYFDATLLLDEEPMNGNVKAAADKALEAMLKAAQGLLKVCNIDISDDPAVVVQEFRTNFYDTQLFFDPFAKGKFASYLFKAYDSRDGDITLDRAREIIEESRLFIEAAHECNARMLQAGITSPAGFKKWMIDREMQTV